MSTPEYSIESEKSDPKHPDETLNSFVLAQKIEEYLQWRHRLDRRLKQNIYPHIDQDLYRHVDEELNRMALELARRDHVANEVQS